MKQLISKIIHMLIDYLLPLRDIVLLESSPDYADNTRAVYNEMIKRGLNSKLKFIWVIDGDTDRFRDIHIRNVRFVKRNSKRYAFYYSSVARYIICGNSFLPRIRSSQKYCFIKHGCALKCTKGKYSLPEDCADALIIELSEYIMPFSAENLSCDVNQFTVLGFPRNDILFNSQFDIHSLFRDKRFNRFIYWMPTFRQHKKAKTSYSNISLPIIYTEEIAERINECAKKNDVLIVLKPHPAQDVSLIKTMNLSNLVFIDNEFLIHNNIDNYELLGASDALLTDYSSVYYDYLLTDKPIGLCWDDYEEYEKREGFAVDMDTVMAGGEKLYNDEDFCSFITRLAAGEDVLQQERSEVKNMIHNFTDGKSSVRVVDYLEKNFFSL